MKNVSKANKGKENLNNLLSSQKISNNHFGISFSNEKQKCYNTGFHKENLLMHIVIILYVILMLKRILKAFLVDPSLKSFRFLKI